MVVIRKQAYNSKYFLKVTRKQVVRNVLQDQTCWHLQIGATPGVQSIRLYKSKLV